jgi:TP901 family phage tail tape measure protein
MEAFSVLATMTLVDLITAPLRAIKAQMVATGAGADSLGMRMGNLARKMAPAALAAGVFLAALLPCVSVAADFEAAISQVGAVARATPAELNQLEQAALDLGASTAWSASQVAEAEKYLSMAGFSVQENIAALPSMLNLASAGATDLGRSADIASDILSAFGLEAREMDRVADVLTATFTTANTNLEMLGDTMKYVGPVAAKAGLDLESTAAMAGLLGNVGIKGSQAGTTLRSMLASLADPAGEASKAMRSLNVDVLDAGGNLRSPITLLGEMSEAMDGMGSGKQLQLLSKVFGREAMSGVAELVGQEGLGGITKYLDIIRNSSGVAGEVAASQLDNAKGSMTMLNSATEGLMITVGKMFLPVIRVMATTLSVVVTGLNAMAGHPVGAFVLKLTAGAAALLIGITLLTAAVWAGTAAWGVFNTVMLANPIGLVVLAVIGLISGLIALYAYCEDFRKGVGMLWENIKGLGGSIYDFFSILSNVGVVGVLAYYFTDAWNAANQLWSGIKSLFDIDLAESGKKMLLTLVQGIESVAMAPFNAVKGVLGKVRNLLPFSDAKEGPLSSLTLSGQKVLDTLGAGIQSAAPKLQMTTSTALEGVATEVQAPVNPSAEEPGQTKASVRREGGSVIIQSLTVQLPGVSDAESFIEQLQALVMNHEPEVA